MMNLNPLGTDNTLYGENGSKFNSSMAEKMHCNELTNELEFEIIKLAQQKQHD